jgi:hypothetical protein
MDPVVEPAPVRGAAAPVATLAGLMAAADRAGKN